MDLENLLSRCLLLDIETTRQGKLRHIGAIFQGQTFERKTPFELQTILHEFDQFAAQADFILGHNLVGHDLVMLQSLHPHLKLLDLPVIDTLYLSPLAFPQNPYHHLVKDYNSMFKFLRQYFAKAWSFLRKQESYNQGEIPAFAGMTAKT